MEDLFSENLTYLLNTKQISVDTILNITKHSSKSLVTMWKTGTRKIMTADLLAISNFLKISVDDLLNKNLQLESQPNNNLDTILADKTKELTEDEKRIIINVIDGIKHKDNSDINN